MAYKDFFEAYCACAAWTATSDDGMVIASGMPDEVPEDVRTALEPDARKFYDDNHHLWAFEDGYGDPGAGHDFWLTRNGHGAGFWDRGLKHGDVLTEKCKPYGGVDVWLDEAGFVQLY